VAKSDERSLLSLQQALRFNPQNVEASRLMANLTESSRSPSALVWRHRVVELSQNSAEDRLALVKTALVFGNYGIATNALTEVPAADQKSAAFHNLAGTAAIVTGQRVMAEQHFIEAARLEPWNSAPVLNLSVIRLHGSNALDMAEARIALRRVSQTATNLDLRCQALRELVTDSARNRQLESALSYSAELLRQTNSAFATGFATGSRARAKPAEFQPTLAGYQRDAGTNDGQIFELARWQMARVGAAETLAWLRTLPMSTQTNQPVTMLIADCRVMVQDWPGLQQTLEKQNWAELEFMRPFSPGFAQSGYGRGRKPLGTRR
jgi:tetratricopeptide (TPR) repeat protein